MEKRKRMRDLKEEDMEGIEVKERYEIEKNERRKRKKKKIFEEWLCGKKDIKVERRKKIERKRLKLEKKIKSKNDIGRKNKENEESGNKDKKREIEIVEFIRIGKEKRNDERKNG